MAIARELRRGLSGSPTAEDSKGSSAKVDEAKVVNLTRRFPHHSEAQVHEALAACEGHAGRATKMLLNTPAAGGLV